MSSPAESEGIRIPFRYAFSGTLRGIYVIRYLLFSGGAAIAGAMVQRMLLGTTPPLTGMAVGLVVGMVLFRGQLRPLRWPTLALSQDAVYLLERKQAVILPWPSIREISEDERRVTLVLSEPVKAPNGDTADRIELDAHKLGTTAQILTAALKGLTQHPDTRQGLPTDCRLRLLYQL